MVEAIPVNQITGEQYEHFMAEQDFAEPPAEVVAAFQAQEQEEEKEESKEAAYAVASATSG